MKKLLQLLLVGCMLCGCTSVSAMNLMENVKSNQIEEVTLSYEFIENEIDFSVEMFKRAYASENSVVSPLSLMFALAMVSNGADNDTLNELEEVLGMDIDDLNKYFYSMMKKLGNDELKISNSIWYKNVDTLHVNENFLQTNADYYSSDIYKASFDQSTVKDMNHWVNEKTDGMIKEIINKINPNTIMYLMNAIAFDAKWEEKYEKKQIVNREFTNDDGTKVKVESLVSQERKFISNEKGKGFIKNYKGNKFSFVGLLPNEDINIDQYIQELTGEEIRALIESVQNVDVQVQIPKFEISQDLNLNEILKNMGIQKAFDADYADFSKMGTSDNGNLYISNVFQKSYISLDENGTKAAAITIIEVNEKSAYVEEYNVVLNRPFVFMILNNETSMPIFIGTVNHLENN